MTITKEKIKAFVENPNNSQLVAKRATQRRGVWVLKYKNRVFYRNLWNDILLECRGTIIDDDYNIIQRPFTKIFNRGERKGAEIPRDEIVIAVEKINGFMGAATWYNDELFVSTTGSIDSEFADMARKWIDPYYKMMQANPHLSFGFEIVDPSDQHIVDEKQGLYLLNAREKLWDAPQHALTEAELDDLANQYGIERPNWWIGRFGDFVKDLKTVKHEGFVCYTPDQEKEIKMKSPYYLVTKFLGRINIEKLDKLLNDPSTLKKRIDEEFYPVIDYVTDNLETFREMERQDRIVFVREYIEDLMS